MTKGRAIEISWVEVLKYFDWLSEWERIKYYLDNNELIKQEKKDMIMRAFTTYDSQFDMDTIIEYL